MENTLLAVSVSGGPILNVAIKVKQGCLKAHPNQKTTQNVFLTATILVGTVGLSALVTAGFLFPHQSTKALLTVVAKVATARRLFT